MGRIPVGFDSRDDVLDVVVADDLADCRLKDADELEFAVEVGMFSAADARAIHAAADIAIADVTSRRWPFDEGAWGRPPPPGLLLPTTLPAGWDAP